MPNFLKNKRNLIFIVLIIISFLCLLWIISKIRGGENSNTTTQTATKFFLVRSVPKNNTKSEFPVTSTIEFSFNKEIDISTLVLTSNPKTDLDFYTNSNKTVLYIRAVGGWKIDTPYTLNIDIKDNKGQGLDERIVFNFIVTSPTTSEMSEIPVKTSP